ncbi:hypothetical protein [Xylophilus sp. GOD-11R]|uniref:hypothetical protein n=1 Tax=Xylophilus sp. GOD-11R TaxID=3089814 RepID=UPI00298C08AC|nr:hypothetical protein [Xylophilus sp. GOD-11R]WPB58842.1 hypothetical protein R9X41_09460 [Xylophilus sp. GOD-11R]
MTDQRNAARCDVQGLLKKEQHTCIKSHVAGLIPVVYEIEFDRDLKLPFAIFWNGCTQPEKEVARLKEGGRTLRIEVMARSGQTVAIFLGSDASPENRKEQLYPVVVGPNDIKVIIKSHSGLNAAEAVIGEPDRPASIAESGDKLDVYHAVLNGKTWMRFSHRYSVDEALRFASEAGEGDAGVLSALTAIYQGQVTRRNGYVARLAHGECAIGFQADADGNCREHIHGYDSDRDFGREVLTRVHPHCWLALFTAASRTQTVSLQLTSTWRPWVGSAVHRMGLGLDVKSIKNKQGQTSIFDLGSPKLFNSIEQKEAHSKWMISEQDYLDCLKKFDSGSIDAARIARNGARHNFEKTMEDGLAWSFENSLRSDIRIKQLYGPIDMDDNTRDEISSSPNFQKSSNETLHKNHVHITASDRFLLP